MHRKGQKLATGALFLHIRNPLKSLCRNDSETVDYIFSPITIFPVTMTIKLRLSTYASCIEHQQNHEVWVHWAHPHQTCKEESWRCYLFKVRWGLSGFQINQVRISFQSRQIISEETREMTYTRVCTK